MQPCPLVYILSVAALVLGGQSLVETDHIACKARNIYYLVLYRRS